MESHSELTLTIYPKTFPYYPVIFLTISAFIWISCNPITTIARTIRNEKDGRKIFYGMMIVEALL
jgi:carbon starvation protein CstA